MCRSLTKGVVCELSCDAVGMVELLIFGYPEE
jgi:hypothetical protein